MTRLAITGHRGLPEHTTRLVDAALRAEIAAHDATDLVGVTCLADGADTLFAQAVLDHGGQLAVIVPAARYRSGLPEEHHMIYDALLAKASKVIELKHDEPTPRSYMDGSLRMLDEADGILAVWDNEPARGFGGTADVVDAARERGIPVTVIWPDGSRRD